MRIDQFEFSRKESYIDYYSYFADYFFLCMDAVKSQVSPLWQGY